MFMIFILFICIYICIYIYIYIYIYIFFFKSFMIYVMYSKYNYFSCIIHSKNIEAFIRNG